MIASSMSLPDPYPAIGVQRRRNFDFTWAGEPRDWRQTIGYSDSASGVYVSTEMFQRLGIADAMKDKARKIPATGRSVQPAQRS
jgi:hypothetical protein